MHSIKSRPVWLEALFRVLKSKLNIIALLMVLVYAIVALMSHFGFIASDWSAEVGASYESPSTRHIFGTDIFGRSVAKKIIKSTEIAISVGLVVGVVTVFLGVILGILAGYFGGFLDEILVWFYSIVSSIPSSMLLVSLAFIMGKGILAVYISLAMTFWTDVFQSVRGEVMRQKNKDYLQAASAIGANHLRKLFIHILPNIMHIVIIRFSIIFQYAIKAEVTLSYLGLGVQGVPSWGIMIDDSKIELLRGVWWQLVFATFFMFLIVMAFNILSDAFRDALDPKLRKL